MLQNLLQKEQCLRQVKGHRYLYRRGEQLVFRRGVPKRVRAAFGGRCEVQTSLGTGSLAEARHLLSRELAHFEKVLSAATGVRSPTEVLERTRQEPGVQEIEEGVREWFAERVGRLTQEVDTISDEQRVVALSRDYEALSQSAAAGVRIGGENAMMTDWIVEALTERFGWQIAAGNPLHRRLTKLVSRGQIEAAQRFQQEVNDEPVRVVDATFSPEQYRHFLPSSIGSMRSASGNVILCRRFLSSPCSTAMRASGSPRRRP